MTSLEILMRPVSPTARVEFRQRLSPRCEFPAIPNGPPILPAFRVASGRTRRTRVRLPTRQPSETPAAGLLIAAAEIRRPHPARATSTDGGGRTAVPHPPTCPIACGTRLHIVSAILAAAAVQPDY